MPRYLTDAPTLPTAVPAPPRGRHTGPPHPLHLVAYEATLDHPDDPPHEERWLEAQELASHGKGLLKLGLFIAGLVFAWLKLSGTNLISIANSVSADILFQSTMALYGAAWLFGLSHDADIQARGFER